MKKLKKALIAGLTLTAIAGVAACKSGTANDEITQGISYDSEEVTQSDKDNKEAYVLSYTDNGTKARNEYYEVDVPDFSISLNDNRAYMLDFDCRQAENGSMLEKKRDLTSFSAAVLVHANEHTSSDLGLLNDNEKNMAVQYALWSFGRSSKSAETKDSQMTESVFDVRNVIPVDEKESESIERVIAAAKVLIDEAKNNPYYVNPKLTIDKDSSKIIRHVEDKYFIVGPYNVSVSGFDIDSIDVYATCDYAECSIVDSEGKKLDKFENNEDIYVKVVPDDRINSCEDTSKIDIITRFHTEGNAQIGKVLGTGESGVTEYAALLDEKINLTTDLNITCPSIAWEVISGKYMN